MRFHLNPTTGEPGPCKAEQACPFGLALEEHYTSKEEARLAYESSRDSGLLGNGAPRKVAHEISLSPATKRFLGSLSKADIKAYVVGGAVRDSYATGEPPKDIDIEAYGVKTDELIAKVKQAGYTVNEVGKSFGVLKVVLEDGMDIDLSLPRRDQKTGTGHRGITAEADPKLTLREAAARRDFTFNALYYDPHAHEIIDYYNGVADLDSRTLRPINEQFKEDPLRVLRAMQFASRFDMKLSPETVAMARDMIHEAATLPDSRKQEEFAKFFRKKGDLTAGFKALVETGWHEPLGLGGIDPQLTGAAVTKARERAVAYATDPVLAQAAATLAQVRPEERSKAAKVLMVKKDDQKAAVTLANARAPKADDRATLTHWARALNRRGLTPADFVVTHGVPKLGARLAKLGLLESAPAPLVTGKRIVATVATTPGPWMAKLIAEATVAQDDGVFATATEADEWIKTNAVRFTGGAKSAR